MKTLILFFSIILFIANKPKAQLKDEPATNTGNSFITLNDINSTAEKNYLKTNTPPDKNQGFYLRRSKTYRIVGWSTLGGGIVLSGLGLLALSQEKANNNDNVDYNKPGILLAAGAASGIVSIPFMIMASVNKHKAMVIVDNQKTGFGVPPNVSRNITGITLRVSPWK